MRVVLKVVWYLKSQQIQHGHDIRLTRTNVSGGELGLFGKEVLHCLHCRHAPHSIHIDGGPLQLTPELVHTFHLSQKLHFEDRFVVITSRSVAALTGQRLSGSYLNRRSDRARCCLGVSEMSRWTEIKDGL